MSRLDALIAEHCPSGVPMLALGDPDVSSFGTGVQLDRSGLGKVGPYAVLNGGMSPSGYHSHFNTVGPAIAVSQGGASAGFVSWMAEPFWAGAHCYVVNNGPRVGRRFLFHVLKWLEPTIQGRARGAGIPGLGRKALAAIVVPVPPVEVQNEIVTTLDHFTELEAVLNAELEARRRQYAYYRTALLTSRDASAVASVSIGEALSLRAGKFIAASEIVSDRDDAHPVPCFGGNGVRGYVAQSNHDGDHVLIGRQGAWSGNVKRVRGEFYATEHAVVVTPILPSDTSWLFHQLTEMNLGQYVSQGAQPGLAVNKLNNVPIQVPALPEQARIGGILDKFDALVNDLSFGLPAELRARRQQHEYYRDELLTFPEAAA